MYSRLIDMISRFIHWYSRLISGLDLSFSESVSNFELDSTFLYSEALFILMEFVYD